MLDFISHGAAVHLPLALAVLMPMAYALTWLGLRFKWLPHSSWRILPGLFLIFFVSAGLAYWTGWQDRAFSMASTEALDRHAELAFRFLLAWGICLPVLMSAFLVKRRGLAVAAHLILLGLLATQLQLAIQLGKAGGALLN